MGSIHVFLVVIGIVWMAPSSYSQLNTFNSVHHQYEPPTRRNPNPVADFMEQLERWERHPDSWEYSNWLRMYEASQRARGQGYGRDFPSLSELRRRYLPPVVDRTVDEVQDLFRIRIKGYKGYLYPTYSPSTGTFGMKMKIKFRRRRGAGPPAPQLSPLEMFKLTDISGDGFIDVCEWTVEGGSLSNFLEFLKDDDSDGDERISYEEFPKMDLRDQEKEQKSGLAEEDTTNTGEADTLTAEP